MNIKQPLFIGALLISSLLSACGLSASVGSNSATPIPAATAAPTTPLPTPTAPSQGPATPAPTAAAEQPAERPTFAFEPATGGAGTTVSLRGWGFTPGATVAIRLGQPHPVGEVLTSATADGAGRWSASLVMPGALPSGEAITHPDITLVVMDDANKPLASAPFRFVVAAGPGLNEASPTVVDLLNQLGSGDVTRFLAANLRAEVAAGRPVHQVLGIHPIGWQSFTVGAPEERPSEVLFVPARIVYPTFVEERVFELVVEDGQWRVHGTSLRSSTPTEGLPPTSGDWPGPEWQQVAHEDFSADGIAERLFIKPAAITPQTNFNDAILDANARPISALLIAQEGAHGLWTMLAVDSHGIIAGDQRIADFLNDADDGISNPAGFLFALAPGSSTLINLLPLNADGTAHGPVLGINWSQQAHGYRLAPRP